MINTGQTLLSILDAVKTYKQKQEFEVVKTKKQQEHKEAIIHKQEPKDVTTYKQEIEMNKFFVVYPKSAQQSVTEIMKSLCRRLDIKKYDLWQYDKVDDANQFFCDTVEPEVEKALFVIAMLDKNAHEDFLVTETVRLCSNLNKLIIPVAVEKVSSRKWSFRSDILYYREEKDRIELVKLMSGQLGLKRIGDVYGSQIVITSDTPCTVKRGNTLIGNITDVNKPLTCVLGKGGDKLRVEAGSQWAEYHYVIPDNNSIIQFKPLLQPILEQSRGLVVYSPGNLASWRSMQDENENDFFFLSGTSLDNSRSTAIYNYYDNQYKSRMVQYPVFHPKVVEDSDVLNVILGILTIGSIVLLFFFFSLGVCGLVIRLAIKIIRSLYKKAVEKSNEVRREMLISETDAKNDRLYSSCNEQMGVVLKKYNLRPLILRKYPTTWAKE